MAGQTLQCVLGNQAWAHFNRLRIDLLMDALWAHFSPICEERKTYFYFYMLKQTPTLSFWVHYLKNMKISKNLNSIVFYYLYKKNLMS
jgi:hypothetical protein